jgi:hypothetical protein
MERKQSTAFITTRKGFCYLTIKIGRHNHDLRRIRDYRIDPEDKRHLTRRFPDILFDWKKIDRQLAEKRGVCRGYRSRRRMQASERRERYERRSEPRDPFFTVSYDPVSRMVFASEGAPAAALLDAVLSIDRALKPAPSTPKASSAGKPTLALVKSRERDR